MVLPSAAVTTTLMGLAAPWVSSIAWLGEPLATVCRLPALPTCTVAPVAVTVGVSCTRVTRLFTVAV